MAVHNRTRKALVKNEGVVVQPGSSVNIAIKKTIYTKLDGVYSKCRKDTATILSSDGDIFKNTLKADQYSQVLCYEYCLQSLYIIPNCGCADPTIPDVNLNITICKTRSNIECINKQRDTFNSQPIGDICDSYCPLECDSVQFSTSLSMAKYPSDYYIDVLSKQANISEKVYSKKSIFSWYY